MHNVNRLKDTIEGEGRLASCICVKCQGGPGLVDGDEGQDRNKKKKKESSPPSPSMGRSALPTECVSCAESSPSPSSPSTSSSLPHANPAAEAPSRASNSARKSNRSSRRSGGRTPAKGSKEAGREGEVGGESSASAPSKARKLSDASRVADNFQNAERPANPKEEEGGEEAMVTEAYPAESSMATDAYPARSQGLDAFSAWCRDRAVAFYGEQKPRIDAFTARMLEWRRRAQLLMRRAWPPLRHALVIMGGIAVTLALTWLNCTIQGFKSLVQLGSAALFMVICCSALNLGILGGFIKLFISLVLSAAAALFLGYSYALVIFGIFSGVILWLCGSFWLTGGIVFIGGVLFTADRPRLAILVGLLYSTYSTKNSGGWLALFLCLNLAFIFSNLMIYWLHSNGPDTGAQDFTGTTQGHTNRADKTQSRRGKQSGAFDATASTDAYQAESLGAARGATTSEGESSAVEKEVERVLSCKDHYAVLELSRFAEVDLASLKRDYRKKAMLVHPDKNLGNAVAEEAFKRLQNAYEVLLDPSKKRGYDDELKKEEVLLALKRFQQEVLRNGRAGTTENSEDEGDEYSATKRIVCKKCNNMHRWICTDRNKLQARWCQECQDHHQAKDGDGWVEQLGHTFFFGMFQKVEVPRAYACAYSKIYEVTEWVQCQGMKCPPNTHKPSFHVSTAGMFKNQSRGTKANKTAYGNGADNFPFAQMNENMTEEEFIKWLENAMASGMFSEMNEGQDQPDTKAGGHAKPNRKKRKGKNKW